MESLTLNNATDCLMLHRAMVSYSDELLQSFKKFSCTQIMGEESRFWCYHNFQVSWENLKVWYYMTFASLVWQVCGYIHYLMTCSLQMSDRRIWYSVSNLEWILKMALEKAKKHLCVKNMGTFTLSRKKVFPNTCKTLTLHGIISACHW